MDWRELKGNPGKWGVFRRRAELTGRIREFFGKEGFWEVSTPLLAPALVPESYLEVFETTLMDPAGKSQRAFLTTSPEMWHKKLLAAGSGNIFEITKSFRNTDLESRRHNPEFTLLEWYRVGADYRRTMEDCEGLVRFLADKKELIYQGKKIFLDKKFERLTVAEASEKFAQIKDKDFFDPERLKARGKAKGYRVEEGDDWETVFNLIYVKEVEPQLGQGRPTFIYDYPAQFAPLAKTSAKDLRVKERFELYIAGMELADAYSELTDEKEQRERFGQETVARRRAGKIDYPADEEFLAALKAGLPECSGAALGVDRLMMLLLDKTKIGEVVLFAAKELFDFEG